MDEYERTTSSSLLSTSCQRFVLERSIASHLETIGCGNWTHKMLMSLSPVVMTKSSEAWTWLSNEWTCVGVRGVICAQPSAALRSQIL
eukprot:1805939-Karenia_brevis.AAC.1